MLYWHVIYLLESHRFVVAIGWCWPRRVNQEYSLHVYISHQKPRPVGFTPEVHIVSGEIGKTRLNQLQLEGYSNTYIHRLLFCDLCFVFLLHHLNHPLVVAILIS
jgi:hypothetical protein